MLRYAADECLHSNIIRAVLRLDPDLDIALITSEGLTGADDDTVLAWAAQQGRVVLTHDVKTMVGRAYARVKAGKPMPGVFEISRTAPIHLIAEHLHMLAECSEENEWEGQVVYVPLR